MPYAAALSQHPVAAQAAGETIGQLLEAVGAEPDVLVAFVGGPFVASVDDIVAAVASTLRPCHFVGVTASGVLGGGQEIENGPSLSLWAGTGLAAETLRLEAREVEGGWTVEGLDALPSPRPDGQPTTVVLLADPFTMPVEPMVEQLSDSRPDLVLIGGMASAASRPGGNRLICDGEVLGHGAVGLVLPGPTEVSAVVSQGCRPAGTPWVVTEAEGPIIRQLGGRTALERLAEAAAAEPDGGEALARGLHLGRVVNEAATTPAPGDFLVRNLLGADRSSGAVVAADTVPVGTTVQFQVRDASSADRELRTKLAEADAAHRDAALVFTCNGRGTNLFPGPHHDAEVVGEALGSSAVAGMFCAGEVGPVANRTFLHGFTASVALFGRER